MGRKAERATQTSFKSRTMAAYMRALGLAPDAYGRLLYGETLDGVLDNGSVNEGSTRKGQTALDRLRTTHPQAWADLERIAERLLGDGE